MKKNVSDLQMSVFSNSGPPLPDSSQSVFQMAVVPQSHLQKIENDIDLVKMLLKQKTDEEMNSQWIDSITARKMLRISTKTWQEYRNKRVIPFSQFGSKIYVKRSDIETFMQSHYITSILDV